MSGRLQGKVAVVTGGTSGIGEATAELFLEEGADVVFTGRDETRGREIEARLGPSALFHRGDVRREGDVAAAIALAVERFGRLDVLFNNAGGVTAGDLESLTPDDFHDAMDLLLGSVLFGIKHAAPVMKRQARGAIINNSSVAALRTHFGGYLYSIAKAGVSHATRLAGMELGPFGVTVNTISPGGVVTPIFLGGSAASQELTPERRSEKLNRLTANLGVATPLGRAGLPRDVAAAALFLASDDGAYVNCHDLVVDGGMTAPGRTPSSPRPNADQK